jgi:hypothetical protein
MDGFCQLFGVPRWLSKATRLMAGLEITLSGDMLVVKQVRQHASFCPDGVWQTSRSRCRAATALCGGCLEQKNCHAWKLCSCQHVPASNCHARRFMGSSLGLADVHGLLLSCLLLLVVQVCKLSWLSTTEAFPVDGLRTAPQRRRDMRSGKCSCVLCGRLTTSSSAVFITVNDAFFAAGTAVYVLQSDHVCDE